MVIYSDLCCGNAFVDHVDLQFASALHIDHLLLSPCDLVMWDLVVRNLVMRHLVR